MNYAHAVAPFKHQLDHFNDHRDALYWGLLWEQGTAKTKPTIDTLCWQYLAGHLDGAVVIAPPGVERNWVSDELPTHLSPDVDMQVKVGIFYTARKHTKDHKAWMEALIVHKGLSVLCISYNAYMTKEGRKAVRKFLLKRRAMLILDESHNIKSPGAKRTLALVAEGRYAKMRRILTGTPLSLGPFDIYSQIRFLSEDFWPKLGIHGATEFRQYFGEYLTDSEFSRINGYSRGFDELIGYRNLEELKRMIKSCSDRYLKEDVLDLPPKLYSKRYFDSTPEQRKMYQALRDELMYELESGEIIDGELPIVRLLRFQQVVCNYVPIDNDQPHHVISKKNPRLEATEQLRDEISSPTIVWTRFHHDVDLLMDLLGDEAVQYDGRMDDDDAERSKLAFQHGDAKWFVGTQAKGGPGLTLTAAKNMIYYANSFKLIDRLQSEDRAHRAGMDEHPLNIYDLCCADLPIDSSTIANLRGKRDIVSEIQGDELREWI